MRKVLQLQKLESHVVKEAFDTDINAFEAKIMKRNVFCRKPDMTPPKIKLTSVGLENIITLHCNPPPPLPTTNPPSVMNNNKLQS